MSGRRNGGGSARGNLRKATVQFTCERCAGVGRRPSFASSRSLSRTCEASCATCGSRLAWRNGADYCIACSTPKESTPPVRNHYTCVNHRLKINRHLPWFLCQSHWEALSLAEQRQYVGCVRRSCDVRASDCDRCPQNGWTAHPEIHASGRW